MCVVLFQAAADGEAEILQELVFKFGQVSIPNDSLINMYNTLGYTMLHYAVMYKRMDCIKTLIELGAGKLNQYIYPLLLSTAHAVICILAANWPVAIFMHPHM